VACIANSAVHQPFHIAVTVWLVLACTECCRQTALCSLLAANDAMHQCYEKKEAAKPKKHVYKSMYSVAQLHLLLLLLLLQCDGPDVETQENRDHR
jgi:hypothetical protein